MLEKKFVQSENHSGVWVSHQVSCLLVYQTAIFVWKAVLHDNKKISKNNLEQILPGTSPQKGEQQDKKVESYEWELPFMYTIFRLLLQIHKWIQDIHRRNCALSRRFGKEHYLSQLHFGRGYSLSLLEVCKSRGYIVDDVTLIRTISVSVKI